LSTSSRCCGQARPATTLLVSDTTRYPGKRRAFFLLNNAGTLTGHHFVPLPHWSIDTMAAAW
jgi:hypothetical protein